MNRKSLDLGLICLFALLSMTVTLLQIEHMPLQLLLGLPLVLILPGYALTAALFPKRMPAWADCLVFTLGLSMGSTILSGFVLNWLPWGVRPDARAVMLAFITLGGSMIAFAGRYLTALALPLHASATDSVAEEQDSAPAALPHGAAIGQNLGSLLLFGLALMIIVGAVVLARNEARQHPPADVIQLWMLPAEPTEPDSVRLGVNSFGAAAGTFRLQLQRDGYILREWVPLVITPGEQWAETVTLRGRQPGDGPIEARLYHQDEPRVVYRKVILWMDISQ
jgi:hypothetical protein